MLFNINSKTFSFPTKSLLTIYSQLSPYEHTTYLSSFELASKIVTKALTNFSSGTLAYKSKFPSLINYEIKTALIAERGPQGPFSCYFNPKGLFSSNSNP